MKETSSSLVRGIADFRDHQKWFEFQNLYRPMIRKILRNKGLQGAELDDGVQEVFIALLSTVDRFQYDRSKGKFRSWISKITERAAFAQRRKRTDPLLDPQHVEASQAQEQRLRDLGDERVRVCLEIARGRFEERTWLPFYLRVVEECPMEEVERMTGMNRNAIYQSVHRVKTCLREMLAQLEPDHGEQR